jgi:uncharacterized protein YpbB
MINAINFLPAEPANNNTVQQKGLSPDIRETYNLLLKEFSLKDIASLRKLNEAVISLQIETIIEFNPEFNIDYLFPGNLLSLINEEIRKGYKDLKELKSRLPSEVTYSLIRIAAAKFKSSSRVVS